MTLAPHGVHHIAVLVSNLAAAEHFYGHVLALPVRCRWYTEDGTQLRSIWFDLSSEAFLAVEHFTEGLREDHRATSKAGWHLLSLTILPQEREAWRMHLAAHGHPVTHETPFTIYFADPEGNRIGMSHYPHRADQGHDVTSGENRNP